MKVVTRPALASTSKSQVMPEQPLPTPESWSGGCDQGQVYWHEDVAGEVVVENSTDMYAGAWMQGGKLQVKGNTNAFTGIGMKGGELVIEGIQAITLEPLTVETGGDAGRPHPGQGQCRSDTGYFMNGGTIIVEGNADVHVGTHQEGGKIIIKGTSRVRWGAAC